MRLTKNCFDVESIRWINIRNYRTNSKNDQNSYWNICLNELKLTNKILQYSTRLVFCLFEVTIPGMILKHHWIEIRRCFLWILQRKREEHKVWNEKNQYRWNICVLIVVLRVAEELIPEGHNQESALEEKGINHIDG